MSANRCLQVEAAKAQIKERDARIKATEEEMAAVKAELQQKSKALEEAKAAVTELKKQVKSQLKELKATSAPHAVCKLRDHWPAHFFVVPVCVVHMDVDVLLLHKPSSCAFKQCCSIANARKKTNSNACIQSGIERCIGMSVDA